MSDHDDLIRRLRERQVMSKFLSTGDLYREQEQQRLDAADALAELMAENERLRSLIGRYAEQVGDAEGVYFEDGARLTADEAAEVLRYAALASRGEAG